MIAKIYFTTLITILIICPFTFGLYCYYFDKGKYKLSDIMYKISISSIAISVIWYSCGLFYIILFK
jgi:hypothetical protein